MGTILMVAVLGFLALVTLIGYNRGLVKTVVSLVSVVVILIVVTILTPTARWIIKTTPLYPYVQERTREFVDDNIGSLVEGVTGDENPMAGLGMGEQVKFINELPIPQNLKDTLINNNTEEGYKGLEVTNFSDYIVISISDMIVNSIAFIILFVVVQIAIKVAIALLDIMSKLPGLNFLNRSGGAVLGFAEALLIVWIGCIIITAFGSTEWGRNILAEINNNVFLSLIYNNNILEKIITGLMS